MPVTNAKYLGDGVYASFDGFQIKLYTQEGMEIYLDPSVMVATRDYIDKLIKAWNGEDSSKGGEETHG